MLALSYFTLRFIHVIVDVLAFDNSKYDDYVHIVPFELKIQVDIIYSLFFLISYSQHRCC